MMFHMCVCLCSLYGPLCSFFLRILFIEMYLHKYFTHARTDAAPRLNYCVDSRRTMLINMDQAGNTKKGRWMLSYFAGRGRHLNLCKMGCLLEGFAYNIFKDRRREREWLLNVPFRLIKIDCSGMQP